MFIKEFDFKNIAQYGGFTLGLVEDEDSDGFYKSTYMILEYEKNDVYEHLGKQYEIRLYRNVGYISGFTYNANGVVETFKERVNELSA
jgi:hypothetical protein